MNQLVPLLPSYLLLIPFLVGQVSSVHFIHRSESSSYHIWKAQEIQETLQLWENQYPQLIRVTTAQERYGLPRAGSDSDCSFEVGQVGCSNYFFTIQDFVAHPEGSRSALILPEVFWSGTMHGREPIGVTVVMESAALLLEAASCEAKPRDVASKLWSKEVMEARRCRDQLRKRGIDDQRRRWLARLVSTRRIVVAPALNSLGFDRSETTEGVYDPEEDFPSIKHNVTSCMETIAARTVNEIFREHMFQIALSFRSGEQDRIEYSWGSEGFEGFTSPDVKALASIASAREVMLEPHPSEIEIGELNNVGNTTRRAGQALDWAYASSWHRMGLQPCKPTSTLGRYSSDKVKYGKSTHRAIALSISTKFDEYEAANSSYLGKRENLFQEGGYNFLVSRNILMTLSSTDLVEPYVSILSLGDTVLNDDLVPLAKRDGRKCQGSQAVAYPIHKGTRLLVEWTVGGGFNFSDVGIWYAKWDEFTVRELDCMFQPEIDIRSDPRFQKGQLWGHGSIGTGAFSPYGPSPPSEPVGTSANVNAMGPTFKGWLYLNNYADGDKIIVFAGAKIDQDWAIPPEDSLQEPNVGPQSHLVNARTNTEWNHVLFNGKKIRGRVDWYSSPATIVVSSDQTQSGTVLLNDRFDKYGIHSGQMNKTKAVNVDALKSFGRALAVMVVLALAVQAFFVYRRWRLARKTRETKLSSTMDEWGESVRRDDKRDPSHGSTLQFDWQSSQRNPVEMEEQPSMDMMDISIPSEPSRVSDNVRLQNRESLDASTFSSRKANYRYEGSMYFQDEARDDDENDCGGVQFESLEDDEEMIDFEDTCAWEKHEVKLNVAFGVDYDTDNMLILKESTKSAFSAERGVMS